MASIKRKKSSIVRCISQHICTIIGILAIIVTIIGIIVGLMQAAQIARLESEIARLQEVNMRLESEIMLIPRVIFDIFRGGDAELIIVNETTAAIRFSRQVGLSINISAKAHVKIHASPQPIGDTIRNTTNPNIFYATLRGRNSLDILSLINKDDKKSMVLQFSNQTPFPSGDFRVLANGTMVLGFEDKLLNRSVYTLAPHSRTTIILEASKPLEKRSELRLSLQTILNSEAREYVIIVKEN